MQIITTPSATECYFLGRCVCGRDEWDSPEKSCSDSVAEAESIRKVRRVGVHDRLRRRRCCLLAAVEVSIHIKFSSCTSHLPQWYSHWNALERLCSSASSFDIFVSAVESRLTESWIKTGIAKMFVCLQCYTTGLFSDYP